MNIRWFEEPVTPDDLPGLRLVREGVPQFIEIAAGEYIYTSDDARMMLNAGAVDVLQADATRCGGITGFCRSARCARLITLIYPRIAHRLSTVMWPAPWRGCAIWSGFTITYGSSRGCSRARRLRMRARSSPISVGLATDSNSSGKMPSASD